MFKSSKKSDKSGTGGGSHRGVEEQKTGGLAQSSSAQQLGSSPDKSSGTKTERSAK